MDGIAHYDVTQDVGCSQAATAFTIVQSERPLCKEVTLDAQRRPQKSSIANMTTGTARRVVLSGAPGDQLRTLAVRLESLQQNEAIIWMTSRGVV